MSTCEAMWVASGINVYFTRYSRYSSIFSRISSKKLFQITEDTQRGWESYCCKISWKFVASCNSLSKWWWRIIWKHLKSSKPIKWIMSPNIAICLDFAGGSFLVCPEYWSLFFSLSKRKICRYQVSVIEF